MKHCFFKFRYLNEAGSPSEESARNPIGSSTFFARRKGIAQKVLFLRAATREEESPLESCCGVGLIWVYCPGQINSRFFDFRENTHFHMDPRRNIGIVWIPSKKTCVSIVTHMKMSVIAKIEKSKINLSRTVCNRHGSRPLNQNVTYE